MATGPASELYEVKRIESTNAYCKKIGVNSEEESIFDVSQLVVTASFGEPIYPCLMPLSDVCNAPDSDLWHTLIEADNYHALQLLEYIYAGKVDCIYIDPPYNTGARDWKYNNDYVDESDSYRHSKWLSMMKKRLLLAKKLLNPKDSVLIVTIDEKEYLHLGCLLEEVFPEARMQMVSSVINHAGVSRGEEFSRSNEFIYFLKFGCAAPVPLSLPAEWRGNAKSEKKKKLVWNQLMRSGTGVRRADRPNMFYPLFVNTEGTKIIKVGEAIPLETPRESISALEGTKVVWPIRSNGEEGRWRIGRENLIDIYSKGYVQLGSFTTLGMAITYLASGEQTKVETGVFSIIGHREDGSIIEGEMIEERKFIPGSQWDLPSHNATYQGSQLLNKVLGESRFSFPKSLYAVHDCLRFFVANKPNALILDFFAGSGTTLHAVNLLNAEDRGQRRCIMVTNNELSADEERAFLAQGKTPNSPEWIEHGIARNVTWPRTVCSIEGHNINGELLVGEYLTTATKEVAKKRTFKQIPFSVQGASERKAFASLVGISQNLVTDADFIVAEDKEISVWFGSSGGELFDSASADDWLEALEAAPKLKTIYICTAERSRYNKLKAQAEEVLGEYTVTEPIKLSMAEGFKANAAFFKLGFLDKNAVSLGWALKELLPILWLKARSHGPCPIMEKAEGEMLILPENRFAVLMEETAFADFAKQLEAHPEISTAYLVTDYEPNYVAMAERLHVEATYQLYKDYLENFTINQRRN